MERKSIHQRNRACDGALSILRGTICSSGCGIGCFCPDLTLDWKREAVVLNNAGQKYTIGSGKNLDSLDPVKYGQFLIFRNNADIAKEQCQIECDRSGNFWLHSLGYSETFVNGKLMQDSPVKLKFGDVFYFSHIFSQLWDPHLAKTNLGKLYRRSPGGKDFAVFKFKRLMGKGGVKRKLVNIKTIYETNKGEKSETGSEDFHKSSIDTMKHPVFDNNVILTKIFEHLANSNQRDLFNCRLVSQSWNRSARLVLQKNYVMKFSIIIDNLIMDPNHLANRLHWKTHRMKELKFDAMKIDIWPQAYNYQTRDSEDRDKAVIRFKQDFCAFINNPDFHPLKVLHMNIDYLTPISTLLSKSCPSLEELYIQINMLWISDEKILDEPGFPEGLLFPKLKKLTLEFSEHEQGDMVKMSESKSLAIFLQGANGIEELVLHNYAKLPCEFDSFKNLRDVTLYGRCEYSVEMLNLRDFLTQFRSLPAGQLRSFQLVICEINVQGTQVEIEKSLLYFLQNQHKNLKNLKIFLTSLHYSQPLKLPRCMPKLKKLWISADMDWTGSLWGVKLGSQVTKKSGGFTLEFNSGMLPMVVREGNKCSQESCPSCNDTLAYGRWHQTDGEFVCYIPNVENIWAWVQ